MIIEVPSPDMAKQATSKFGGVQASHIPEPKHRGSIHNQVLGFIDHAFIAAEKRVENRGSSTYIVPIYKMLLISYHRWVFYLKLGEYG